MVSGCYYIGDGVEKDTAEAMKWHRKAAEQRHNDAMQNLAHCYRHGFGVEQDEAEADRWDELAEAAEALAEHDDDDDENEDDEDDERTKKRNEEGEIVSAPSPVQFSISPRNAFVA